MIHVVFQHADIAIIEEAMKLEASLQGEIVEIIDEWGVGPLQNLDTEEGWNYRVEWWKQLLDGSPYAGSTAMRTDDRETVKMIKEKLETNPEEKLWIWLGQNQHDVTGYYWLIPQLSAFEGRVMILYLNNLPFINEKGQLFYPTSINQILPREAVKAARLARAVTPSEFEVDPDEWRKLSEENAMVRILEGGKKIDGKPEDFYDQDILKICTKDWQKATRVLQHTLNKMKIRTGDVYLMWRIRKLIENGKLEAMGNPNGSWKEFDIRMAGSGDEKKAVEEKTEGA